ncbi:MAG: 6-bladed beta-propeller [Candidatus Delongbacteria bacterium]|nr:6-bladed beta-propeller [Candidatus Delongbacteria bacterium]
MKSLKTSIQILVVLIFFSCNDKNTVVSFGTAQDTISFNFEKDVKDPSVFFDLVDSLKLVKLQTNADYLIGVISKILCDEHYLYILDERSKSVFKYTKEGEFVLKISRLGKGPGEFIQPSDFCLLDDAIVIFDDLSRKIIIYDKNGGFHREFKQKSVAEIFAKIDTNHFAMLNQDNTSPFSNKNILIVNENGKKVNEFMEITSYSKDKNLALHKPVEYYEDEILYTEAFNNRIFGITKDSVYVKYFFDFGEYNLDENFLNANRELTASELILKMNSKNRVNSLDYYNENSKYLSFLVFRRGRLFSMYFNKKEGVSHIFDQDLYPMWLSFLNYAYIYSDEQFFVTVCPPNYCSIIEEQEMNKMKENRLFSKVYEEIRQKDEMSNPYLLYYYFK